MLLLGIGRATMLVIILAWETFLSIDWLILCGITQMASGSYVTSEGETLQLAVHKVYYLSLLVHCPVQISREGPIVPSPIIHELNLGLISGALP